VSSIVRGGSEPVWQEALELGRQLRARGLVLETVVPHPSRPWVLVVYLRAAHAQWVDGFAATVIRDVPGVDSVADWEFSETALIVHLQIPQGGTWNWNEPWTDGSE
jgi:hypothetical protein